MTSVPANHCIEEIPGQPPVITPKSSSNDTDPVYVTRLEFLDLLGDTIAVEILTAAKTDPVIELLNEKSKAATKINLHDPEFVRYMNILVDHPEISLDSEGRDLILRGERVTR